MDRKEVFNNKICFPFTLNFTSIKVLYEKESMPIRAVSFFTQAHILTFKRRESRGGERGEDVRRISQVFAECNRCFYVLQIVFPFFEEQKAELLARK